MKDFYVLAVIDSDGTYSLMIAPFYYSERIKHAKKFSFYRQADAYRTMVLEEENIHLSIVHIEVVKE